MTDSFVEPTQDNFGSKIIKNGSPISDKIKELIETTKPWLKVESVSPQGVPEPENQLDTSGYPEIEFETNEALKAERTPPF